MNEKHLDPTPENFNSYELIIGRLLEADHLQKFFYVTDGVVFQEKDVVDSYGHGRRVDRLIIKKDEAWIVDYKSSRFQTGPYQSQVWEYMRILKELFPGKAVKGFLLYLDDMSMEEVIEGNFKDLKDTKVSASH